MFRYLYPDEYASSIFDIPYNNLRLNGTTNILLDIDNTTAPVSAERPGTELVYFFYKLRDMGFKICILSNGSRKRVEIFAEAFGVPYVAKARKPFSRGVGMALELLSAKHSNAVIIGDQIFTDILCGKRAKIRTVLVKPISPAEEWFVKLKRVFEKPVLAEYFRERPP